VRQIDNCLDELLADHAGHFIQEDGNDNSNEGVQEQLYDGNDQCVPEGAPEFLLFEQLRKVVKTYEVDITELIAVERVTDAKHGPVVNDQNEDENRKGHQVEASVVPHSEL
jgi:hypothetical protein